MSLDLFFQIRGHFPKKKKKFFNKLCRGCWCQLRSEEEEEATGRGKQSSRICQLSFFLVSTNGEVSRGSPRIQTMWQWILKGISNESNCWRPHPFLLTMGFAILCISWRLRHGNKMWSLLLWQTQHKHDFLSFQSNSLMFSNFLKTSPVELPASQMKCSHLKMSASASSARSWRLKQVYFLTFSFNNHSISTTTMKFSILCSKWKSIDKNYGTWD